VYARNRCYVGWAPDSAKAAATAAAAAAKKAAESTSAVASAAAEKLPEGFRDAVGNLYHTSKSVAESAVKSVAETAGGLGETLDKQLGGFGGGMGGVGGVKFDMEAALAGLKVGLGGGNVGTVRMIAGETSGLGLLLQRCAHACLLMYVCEQVDACICSASAY
jgi:hypothetical protein